MTGRQIQKRPDDRISDGDMARGAGQLPPGAKLVRVDTGYQTAISVQLPRNLGTLDNPGGMVLTKSLIEARLMGEEFFFAWDVRSGSGTKEISGITIDGAMMLLRNWGNAAVDVEEVISQDNDAYVFKATFIDLETGSTCNRLYRKHRSNPPGGYERQRWDDGQFSDGQSRAIRNVICAALPQWLKAQAKEQAIKAAEKKIDPVEEKRSILARAAAVGVDQKQLEGKFGKLVSNFDAADIVTCRAMLRTVEEKYAKAAELFAAQPPPAEPSRSGTPTPQTTGDGSLVATYAKQLKDCWTESDLEAVRGAIKQAVEAKKLTDDEAAELRDIYRSQRALSAAPPRPAPSSPEHIPDADFDDAREPS